MSSTDTIHKAKLAASTYLEMRGYKVLERDWRRPRCEIDIVASKEASVHFVAVSYSRKDEAGTVDTLTPTKLLHMQRAAWAWVDENEYKGKYALSAVEVAGPSYAILSFVENVV